jgi:hypothetical protein
MIHIRKALLTGALATLLAAPAFAQTANTAQLNGSQYLRYYGGLNPALANGSANGAMLPQGGAFQPGQGIGPDGMNAPGTITQGSATAGIQSSGSVTRSLLRASTPASGVTGGVPGATNVRQSGGVVGRTAASAPQTYGYGTPQQYNYAANTVGAPGLVPGAGQFYSGSGVPGSGLSSPGTIVQGAANPVLQQQQAMSPANFNRFYSGLNAGAGAVSGSVPNGMSNVQTAPGTAYQNSVTQPAANGAQGTTTGVQGTPTGAQTTNGAQGTAPTANGVQGGATPAQGTAPAAGSTGAAPGGK